MLKVHNLTKHFGDKKAVDDSSMSGFSDRSAPGTPCCPWGNSTCPTPRSNCVDPFWTPFKKMFGALVCRRYRAYPCSRAPVRDSASVRESRARPENMLNNDWIVDTSHKVAGP